jgi:hypothetical protein
MASKFIRRQRNMLRKTTIGVVTGVNEATVPNIVRGNARCNENITKMKRTVREKRRKIGMTGGGDGKGGAISNGDMTVNRVSRKSEGYQRPWRGGRWRRCRRPTPWGMREPMLAPMPTAQHRRWRGWREEEPSWGRHCQCGEDPRRGRRQEEHRTKTHHRGWHGQRG